MARRNSVKEESPLLESVVDPLVEELDPPRITLAQADDAVRAVEVNEEPESRVIRQAPNEGLQVIQGFTARDLIELDLDKLERLVAMQDRQRTSAAKAAFDAALSRFQELVPVIPKKKKGYDNRYSFAPLGDIERLIKGAMKECGLSKRWEQQQAEGQITITCIVTHVAGHSERNPIGPISPEEVIPDNKMMNPMQRLGAAISYLERYSLKGVLGLVEEDEDTDARVPSGETISDEQVSSLRGLIAEFGIDEGKFLRFMTLTLGVAIETLEDIPEHGFSRGVAKIKETKAAQTEVLVASKEAK